VVWWDAVHTGAVGVTTSFPTSLEGCDFFMLTCVPSLKAVPFCRPRNYSPPMVEDRISNLA
jgi:hypothetical protein